MPSASIYSHAPPPLPQPNHPPQPPTISISCTPGMLLPGHDLDGGPTQMKVADVNACAALCQDTEYCSAYVFRPRQPAWLPHGNAADYCFPINSYAKQTNLPPLWPGAECQLKGPLAVGVKLLPDNCSCTGYSEPACSAAATVPAASAGNAGEEAAGRDTDTRAWTCEDMCPTAGFPDSFNVECGVQRRGQ